jgi:hypothetical protein
MLVRAQKNGHPRRDAHKLTNTMDQQFGMPGGRVEALLLEPVPEPEVPELIPDPEVPEPEVPELVPEPEVPDAEPTVLLPALPVEDAPLALV